MSHVWIQRQLHLCFNLFNQWFHCKGWRKPSKDQVGWLKVKAKRIVKICSSLSHKTAKAHTVAFKCAKCCLSSHLSWPRISADALMRESLFSLFCFSLRSTGAPLLSPAQGTPAAAGTCCAPGWGSDQEINTPVRHKPKRYSNTQ